MTSSLVFGRQVIARHLSRCLTRLPVRSIHVNACHRTSNAGAMPTGGGSYEGDGKTTINFVNKDMFGYLLVDTYSMHGFRLSNEMFAYGPIALFPSTVLQWDVRNAEDINEKSLSLFSILEPRIEVLVIGVGDDTLENRASTELNRRLRSILQKKKINCEILSTKHAITTYNYLCVDHRVCAGAFIPPLNPDFDKEEDPWLTQRNQRFLSQSGNVFN